MLKTPEYNDYPFDECVEKAKKMVAGGWDVHQKFTCSGCGSRQTIEEPNKFYTSGRCEECGVITAVTHCNYLLISA